MTKDKENLEVKQVVNALSTINQENLDELKQLKNNMNQKLFDITKQQLYNRIHTTLKINQQALQQKKDTKAAVRQMKIALQTINKYIDSCHLKLQETKAKLNKNNKQVENMKGKK